LKKILPNNSRMKKGLKNKGKARKGSKDNQRPLILVFSLYVTFIFLTQVPYLAQMSVESNMDETYEYNLTFTEDGFISHYYVERYNQAKPGTIHLVYYTATNTLDVEVRNIRTLWIYCQSVFEDEAQKVYKLDPFDSMNFYKYYFIERDHLHVNIENPAKMEDLKFLDTPRPQKVTVNSIEWDEGVRYNFTQIGGIAFSEVPPGDIDVDLYFKSPDESRPYAVATANPLVAPVGYEVTFDGKGSYDLDGMVVSHVWDFGDGDYIAGKKTKHSFESIGTYMVILTVEDDSGLLDQAYCNITVISDDGIPKIAPIVPNQVKIEDSPSWSFDLSDHLYDPQDIVTDPIWSVTGNDPSICILSFNNVIESDDSGSPSSLWFTPVPNTWGDQKVTLWLLNKEDIVDSQDLWINITPVNDPPSIINTPRLIIHYDADYTFDYTPYIYDIDNPLEDLTMLAVDPLEEDPVVDGFKVTYWYPESLLGTSVYATLTVNDGMANGTEIVQINITDDWVPIVKKQLPNIEMYEGEVLFGAFDLDDYFDDPDGDALFFSYGETYIDVVIQHNHSVDISAPDKWSGVDTVTFRAKDPIGALAEDTILVTVWPVNDQPSISGVPDLVVHHSIDYPFDLSPYISDEDNEADELALSTSNDDFCTFDPLSPTIMVMNYPEFYNKKTLSLTITVSDGQLTDSQTINVKVTDNHPPVKTLPIPDITFKEDSILDHALYLPDYFEDPDAEELLFSHDQEMLEIEIEERGWVNFKAKRDWFGTEEVTFRASDTHQAIAEDIILVTVLPVNDAPGFYSIPTQNGTIGDVWIIDLMDYIFDVDDPISSLEVSVEGPEGLAEVRGMDLMISPWEIGQVEFTLHISDGDLENTTTVRAVIEGAPTQVKGVGLNWFIFYLVLIMIAVLSIGGALVYRRHQGNYQLEVLLLTDNDAGNLITSRTASNSEDMDNLVIGNMFTVVSNFIKESFGNAFDEGKDEKGDKLKGWDIRQFSLKGHTILLEKGNYVFLAAVVSGRVGTKLEKKMKRFMDEVEGPEPTRFKNWDGNKMKIRDVELRLDNMFPELSEEKAHTTAKVKSRKSSMRGSIVDDAPRVTGEDSWLQDIVVPNVSN